MDSIRESYELLLGSPVHTTRLRSPRQSSTVPTELDLLYFRSACPDAWPHREFTLIATSGLSARAGQRMPSEMSIRIDGECGVQAMDALGRALAELAVVPFREGCCFEPLSILEGVQFPPFTRMRHALVAHWFVTTPAWLPAISPPVLLLMLIPIMPAELDWLAKFGPRSTYMELERRGVSIYDPFRSDTLEVT